MKTFDLVENRTDKPKNRCVVRLRTTMWADNRGAYLRKSITFLKKQSTGYNFLKEDVSSIGAEEVFPRILNLDECRDGIYELIVCNVSRDFETGYVDDYDYKLVEWLREKGF